MTAKKDQGTMEPVKRNSVGMRDILFDEIDLLRNGQSNPTRCNAVAKLCAEVRETVNMDIAVAEFARKMAKDGPTVSAPALPSPVQLGA